MTKQGILKTLCLLFVATTWLVADEAKQSKQPGPSTATQSVVKLKPEDALSVRTLELALARAGEERAAATVQAERANTAAKQILEQLRAKVDELKRTYKACATCELDDSTFEFKPKGPKGTQ